MRYSIVAAALVLSAGGVMAETVDNPEFANWKKFPKGTTITLKVTSDTGGMGSETSMTVKLVEAGADKVVLEATTTIKVMGREIKTPPTKREVARTVELPKGAKKDEFKAGKPPGTVEQGSETVKVGAGSFKTKWFKYKAEMGALKTEAKVWRSDDVPGGMVKMEATNSGPVSGKMKMELLEFKKP